MVFDYIKEVSGIVVGIITTVSAAVMISATKTRSDKELAETRKLVADDVIDLKDDKIKMLEDSNEKLAGEVKILMGKIIALEEQFNTLLTAVFISESCLNAPSCPNRRLPVMGGETPC